MSSLPIKQPQKQTEVGSYFIANYPPFSFWKPEHVDAARRAVDAPPAPDTPLGLYLHIPFCRKRCKFCYFRVYTDKNADEIEVYLDALEREIALYSELAVLRGRPVRFAYFGGGTPSFLSARQLASLAERLRKHVSWDDAEEVTFECEPGTLQKHKLQAIRDMGVTRLSLGIEHFDDAVLAENGRAHLSKEIYRAYEWIREVGFPQVNIDLIAGMVGETTELWHDCIRRTLELSPDSVTIYQMELPHNTTYSRDIQSGGASPVAGWDQKRAWVDYAFSALAAEGYEVSSAYTMVKKTQHSGFVYRDSLWRGADMLGTGVASFSHIGGVHFQNVDGIEEYVEALGRGELPLGRALPIDPGERLIREMILQLKTGRISAAYFREKFGVEILEQFAEPFARLSAENMLAVNGDAVVLTWAGMLRVDALLPSFFRPEHRGARYT